MTTLDKTTLKALRLAINAALAPLAQAHGITIVANGCAYNPEQTLATFKLELTVPNADGESNPVVIRAQAAWARYAKLFNLEPEWLGKRAPYAGSTRTIVGLAPNRTKFPVLVRDEDGKLAYIPASDALRRLLAKAEPAGATA